MRYILIFVMFILFASFAYADKEVFNKYINSTQTFAVDDVDYTFKYSFSSSKAVIESKFSKIILPMWSCKEIGDFEFCLNNMTTLTEEEDTQFQLIVNEKNCSLYNLANGSKACMIKIGKNCSSDYSCVSNKCLHNVCTFIYPICGDGYCDNKERCTEDCENKTIVNETVNETAEEIVENKTDEKPAENKTAVKTQEVIVEKLPEPEKKPLTAKNIVIWIALNAIIISVGYTIGYKIYKKRKGY